MVIVELFPLRILRKSLMRKRNSMKMIDEACLPIPSC